MSQMPWEMDWQEAEPQQQAAPQLPWEMDWSGHEAPQQAQPERRSGVIENLAAGANDTIYSILGAPVDAATWVTNKAVDGINAVTGAELPYARNDLPGSSRSLANAGAAFGIHDPATVEPRGPMERAMRATGAGAVGAIAPATVVGALGRAGMLTPQAMQKLAPLVGDMGAEWFVGNQAAQGAAGGLAGSAAAQAAEAGGYGEFAPLAEMAGGMAGGVATAAATQAAGAAVRAPIRAASDYVARTPQAQQRVAGRLIREAASDPHAVANMDTTAIEMVPGSQPTTFQASGDMGLGSLERAVATRNPEHFMARRADQNAARLAALDGLAPDGAPDALSRSLRGDAAEAAANAGRQIDDATAAAIERSRALGGHGAPEAYGADMRSQLQAGEGARREAERALWQGIDAEDALSLPASGTSAAARDILDRMPQTARPMEGEEAAIFGIASRLGGDPVPFRDVTALRSRISEAMREELKTNGRSATYARLAQLRGSIEADIEGLSGIAPDAHARLQEASAATRERAQTFRPEPVASITRTRGMANEFVTPDAMVPDRVFVPGPKGAANVQAYLRAAGDDAASGALHDTAVASMRRAAERPNGTIDPQRFETWRAKHADALRALPDTDRALRDAAGASAAVDDLAVSARQAAEMRQAGAVGRLLELEDPADVVRTVGGLFGRQDSVAQMQRLAEATAGNVEARQGLRKAIAEHITNKFVSNTEAGTSGQPLIKADQFQTFLKQNREALGKVFSSTEMASLKAIADDLARASRSMNAVRIPGQSNTAQDLAAMAKGEHSGLSVLLQGMSAIGATTAGGPLAGAAAYITTSTIAAMRRRGMAAVDDLVREALLNPQLAVALLRPTSSKVPNTVGRVLMHGARAGAAGALAAGSTLDPDAILNGAGKPFPSKGVGLDYLRRRGHDPDAFDLRPVEGGFIAVPKR